MGGNYYDRDVISSNSSTGFSAQTNNVVGVSKSIHLSMDPTRFKENKLKCDKPNPIIFALDVTGSMGNWSKIIYEKMPMFYGQIMMQNYLKDPSISFCAVGDATSDQSPLQVSEFGQGKEIDQLIGKMYLEGGGGGNQHESYELSAYFYDHHVELTNVEIPFFFLTGDEGYWEKLSGGTIDNIIGANPHQDFIGKNIWQDLMKKYNVFLIKKPFTNLKVEPKIIKQWNEALGEERVLLIKTPKACIDVILGAIAITSGARTMEGYIKDMKDRQQSEERIEEVSNALIKYVKKFEQGQITVVKSISHTVTDSIPNSFSQKKNNEFDLIKEMAEKLILVDNLDDDRINFYKSLRKLHSTNPLIVSKDLLCPITNQIFFDPVLTCDGISYERKAIEQWLLKYNTSPVTNLALESKDLIPNLLVKNLVNNFYETSKHLI